MRSTSIEILGFVFDIDRDFWPQLTFFEGFLVRQHIPMRHIPKATFTHATFTHRRHLPIASIRHDAWSIRYLIVVAYGYLSRENWDLIEAMGKCRLWVNVAWVNVAMGICRMGICRLTVLSLICLSKPSSFTEDLAYHLKLLPCLYTVENKLSRVKGFQSLGFDKTIS